MKLLAASVVAILFCLLAAACTEAELHPSFDLKVGDCIDDRGLGEHESVKHVNCSEPGAVRVVGVFDVVGYSAWPGYSLLDSEASHGCPWSTISYWGPTKESWEQGGDREIVCVAKAN